VVLLVLLARSVFHRGPLLVKKVLSKSRSSSSAHSLHRRGRSCRLEVAVNDQLHQGLVLSYFGDALQVLFSLLRLHLILTHALDDVQLWVRNQVLNALHCALAFVLARPSLHQVSPCTSPSGSRALAPYLLDGRNRVSPELHFIGVRSVWRIRRVDMSSLSFRISNQADQRLGLS